MNMPGPLTSMTSLALMLASPAEPGVDGAVYALAADSHGVYVAGDFAGAGGVAANNVARWDGSAWHALGDGVDGPVFAVLVDGDGLYAGGEFGTAGGAPAHNLARWDGAQWSDVAGGVSGPSARVQCLARDAAGLLVGGAFTEVGVSTPANGLARWTGLVWEVLGGFPPGIEHDIRAVVSFSGTIYVGGVLHFPGSTRPSEATLARATPLVLSDHAGSANANDECAGCASVDALATNGVDLFVAGAFTHLGEVTALGSPYEVVRLVNAAVPFGLGDGPTLPSVVGGGAIRALAASGGSLYAGGNVLQIRGVSVNHVARWNGAAWSALGSGVSAPVRTIVVWNGDVYAGGDFITAGGATVHHVARWDGSAWSPLAGVTTPVESRSWGSLKGIYR